MHAMMLGSVKAMYLALDNSNKSQKRALESLFNRIAISENMHPTPVITYEPVIKTTLDFSGNKRCVHYRELQQQMRIDALFARTDLDNKTVGTLLNYAD